MILSGCICICVFVCLGLDYFASVFSPENRGPWIGVVLILNHGLSEVSRECAMCLLRSLLSGLFKSPSYPSPAQLLESPFSCPSWRSCSILGLQNYVFNTPQFLLFYEDINLPCCLVRYCKECVNKEPLFLEKLSHSFSSKNYFKCI